MKNIVSKYVLTLFGLLVVCTIIHFLAIAPTLETFILDDVCSGILQMFSLFIAEPVICVIIIVGMINHQEKQYYDSIS
ncbi:hypothetical protein [Candidatus Stoquefichus sp. SB1]|uniref:hypothetical protein n=1 Tax=Candidatus Stoquefichus sp. SB1 TaxID=1658109 RepID=UPI00067EADF1|nr:hypothetical protein [Candidatus Stoquefichus sp. SB1]